MENPVTLTKHFNKATVKAGDLFEIDVREGGVAGLQYKVEVVSGTATEVDVVREAQGFRHPDQMVMIRHIFRAEKAGDIQIVAHERRPTMPSDTFTIKVI